MKPIGNTMKYICRLMLVVVLGVMLATVSPVMAAPAPQAQGSPHGAVWQEWQPLAEGFVARRRVPERLELPKELRQSPATQERVHPGRDLRPWEMLSLWFYTDAPGLYSVSIDDVSAETGIGASQLHGAAKSGRLSFLNGDEAVSWYYNAKQRRILFAGEAYETFYAEGNAYQLVQTRNPDTQRMTERGNPKSQVSAGMQTPFREVLHFEEETDMMFFLHLDPTNQDSRYWFWDYLYGAYRPQIQIPLHIPDPADFGAAQIKIRLYGLTDIYPGNDHSVFAKLNGVTVGSSLSWDGLNPAEFVADFDQTLLNANGDNILTLYSDYDAKRRYPGELLESIAVEYDRMAVAVNGQIWMRNVDQGIQEVTGFSSGDILVIESPVRNAVIRRDVNVYEDWNGGWAVVFEAKGGRDYLIAEMSSTLIPLLDAREQTDLTASGNAANYLIITPREFAGTAQALAEHRQDQYGQVKVVWLDDIYKTFSAGREDPFAIGRFMNHAMMQWAATPSAVILLGKGSVDRKDRMGYGDNFLPVLMTSNPWFLAASDARLLGVEDGVAPFAYGRLPLTNDAEGQAYVDKIIEHELGQRSVESNRAVVVADNPDKGGDFHSDADQLAAQLSGLGFESVKKLYHPAGSVRANLTMSETWTTGFVSYSGHASWLRLGAFKEDFINFEDANVLRNSVYPMFIALTCDAGKDFVPGSRSIAGALVLNPEGGAIAALAPTSWSSNADAHILGSAFVDYLYGSYATVGEAYIRAAFQTEGQVSDFMVPMYFVIGDPGVYMR